MPESVHPSDAPETWTRAAFDALAAHLAVLDARGTIVAVNAAWERFGRTQDAPPITCTGIGLNYLDVCRRAAAAGNTEAQDALTGLQAVLQGRQASFTREYPCHAPGQPRWFLLHATPLPPPHQGLVLAHLDITTRKQAEDQLRAALREKDVLLREVAHRVKNNLQVISSLLSLQAGAIEDPRLGTLFQASQDRLHAMALVHDLLQQADDVSRINLAHYAARLIEALARTYAVDPARLTLETEFEDVWVGLDTATPCGLLLHELLTNCFTHAFPEGRTGHVRVALRATDSLGLQLVCAMAEQLQGTITLERAEGTQFTITVPLGP